MVEACEYDRSFLNLRPRRAAILNIEEDHLDYYADLDAIAVEGKPCTLEFGRVKLPRTHWYYDVPSWATSLVHRQARVRPRLSTHRCVGCGRCIEVCPAGAISRQSQPLDSRGRTRRVLAKPPVFDLNACVGCLCCVEVCPVGALEPHRNLLVRLIGMGR